jgi:hypothetical protein
VIPPPQYQLKYLFLKPNCVLSRYITAVIYKSDMADGGGNTGNLLLGLNPDAPVFNMDDLLAAAANLHRDCPLPDFVIEKPEAWFKCVEDAKVVKPKNRYNKVHY